MGRYLVTGELGRGGMGLVYEGWDPGIERRVAIKTLEPERVPEEDRTEIVHRFRRETRVVGQLTHRSIVTIFDSGLERGADAVTGELRVMLLYYVMEYLEGRSVGRHMRERGRLSEEAAVQVAIDIAEALQLVHQAGIIHRDIKPSNVFLRDNGHAVLLDFGIAKVGDVPLTRQGEILGTPSYLAPERLFEKEIAIDGRADIFSLGVLLFTMLTGEAPFVGDDLYEIIDKISKQTHPRLHSSTPAGHRLAMLIDRMLAKRPEERIGSADEVVESLRSVLAVMRGSVMPSALEADESEEAKTPPAQPPPPPLVSVDGAGESTPSLPVPIEVIGGDLHRSAVRPSAAVHSGERIRTYPEPAGEVADVGEEDTIADTAQPIPEALRRAPVMRAVPAHEGEVVHSKRYGAVTNQADIVTQTVRHLRPKRSSAIEASLVDEDDVVVKPAPLSKLMPDELPTQTQIPGAGELIGPVVEGPREGGGPLDPAEFAGRSGRHGLGTEFGWYSPGGAVDDKSAAVARRTFGATKSEHSLHHGPTNVLVRVRGDPDTLERTRSIRRTVFLLLCAGMASVAIGVLIGRNRASLRAALPAVAGQIPDLTPKVEPQSILRRDRENLEPRLLRPRSAREIFADAQAARLGGEVDEAARLFDNAMRAAPEGSQTQARAALGRADLLRQLGRNEEAAALYRVAMKAPSDSRVSRQAQVALEELGVSVRRGPVSRVGRSSPRPARPGPAESERPHAPLRAEEGEARGPVPDKRSPKTPIEKCRAIGRSTFGRPQEAIRRLRSLQREHPNAACIFFALGLRYEEVNDARAALTAYRQFVQLAPSSPRRPAVVGRIDSLERRLRSP